MFLSSPYRRLRIQYLRVKFVTNPARRRPTAVYYTRLLDPHLSQPSSSAGFFPPSETAYIPVPQPWMSTVPDEVNAATQLHAVCRAERAIVFGLKGIQWVINSGSAFELTSPASILASSMKKQSNILGMAVFITRFQYVR